VSILEAICLFFVGIGLVAGLSDLSQLLLTHELNFMLMDRTIPEKKLRARHVWGENPYGENP